MLISPEPKSGPRFLLGVWRLRTPAPLYKQGLGFSCRVHCGRCGGVRGGISGILTLIRRTPIFALLLIIRGTPLQGLIDIHDMLCGMAPDLRASVSPAAAVTWHIHLRACCETLPPRLRRYLEQGCL